MVLFETDMFFKVDTCPKPQSQKKETQVSKIISFRIPNIPLNLQSNKIASYSIHSSVSYLFLSNVYHMIFETDSYAIWLNSISVISGDPIYHVIHFYTLNFWKLKMYQLSIFIIYTCHLVHWYISLTSRAWILWGC
jgi:hypothetical protein